MANETTPAPKVGPAKGILHGRVGTESFHHARHAASDDLAFFVAHYWIVSWDLRGQPPFLSETLPHPCVHIVFEPRRPEVGGIATGRFSRRLKGEGRVFGIKFRPAGFQPFFGAAVGTLANRTVTLRSVFGNEALALRRDILADPDERHRIQLAEAFLRARLPPQTPEVAAIRDLVERMAVDRDLTRVEQAAELLGTDTRQLQRQFRKLVGVSPKWVIQRYRLHEAAEALAADPGRDMTSLAQELGYFDQAHFSRAFKAIVGRSPGQYAKDRRDDGRASSGKDMASQRRQ